jgi:hypothetical protein
MSTQIATQERSQLHYWIDDLPPKQLDLVYRLVEELIEDEQDETAYLLSSKTMRDRLLAARASGEGIPVEVVREELGI